MVVIYCDHGSDTNSLYALPTGSHTESSARAMTNGSYHVMHGQAVQDSSFPSAPKSNVVAPIVGSILGCAFLFTLLIVSTFRKHQEARRTFHITPFYAMSTLASQGTSPSDSSVSRNSMFKSPIPPISNDLFPISPSLDTPVETPLSYSPSIRLPSAPPPSRSGSQRRKSISRYSDVDKRILMFGKYRATSFLPRYQANLHPESELLVQDHHPPPAYQSSFIG